MNEQDYRSYMDSIEFEEDRHQRLMNTLSAGGRTPARGWSRVACGLIAAAACVALVFAAGHILTPQDAEGPVLDGPTLKNHSPAPGHQAAPGRSPQPTPSQVPAPTPSQVPAPTPAPTPSSTVTWVDSPYALIPADPFDGQPHSSPAILGVEWNEDHPLSARIRRPDGWLEKRLTREDIIYLLGGQDATDAPWMLGWTDWYVSGSATYGGDGKLWEVELTGSAPNSAAAFTLTLAPGDYPPTCYVDPDQTATDLNGVTVYGSRRDSWISHEEERWSLYYYNVSLLNGDVGLRFSAKGMDRDAAADLATRAANVFAGAAPHLDNLLVYDGDIPDWRSESLTLKQATDAENVGPYAAYVNHMAQSLPAGFTFESARIEQGQDRDYLSVCWTGYYASITATFRELAPIAVGSFSVAIRSDGTVWTYGDTVHGKLGENTSGQAVRSDGTIWAWGSGTLVDAEDKERYDQRLYTIPYADSVPDEVMFGGFQDPMFRVDDLSLDVMEARLVEQSDGGDLSGYRGNFSVLYGDGMRGQFSFKGVTPQEALDMVARARTHAVTGETVYGDIVATDPPEGDPDNGDTPKFSSSRPAGAFTVMGAAGATAGLDADTSKWLCDLLLAGTWAEGTTDCAGEYVLEYQPTGLEQEGTLFSGWLNYHSECGTVNDVNKQLSLKLSDADRERLNAALSGLKLSTRLAAEGAVWVWPDVPPCPHEDCTQAGEHDHDGVTYCGPFVGEKVWYWFNIPPCPHADCAQMGEHDHDGNNCFGYAFCDRSDCTLTSPHYHGETCYRGCAPCSESGCTQSGLHYHGDHCYRGHSDTSTGSSHHSDSHHSDGHH